MTDITINSGSFSSYVQNTLNLNTSFFTINGSDGTVLDISNSNSDASNTLNDIVNNSTKVNLPSKELNPTPPSGIQNSVSVIGCPSPNGLICSVKGYTGDKTALANTNSSIEHSCDFTKELKQSLFYQKLNNYATFITQRLDSKSSFVTDYISPIIDTIRKAIQALTDFLNEIQTILKKIKGYISKIKDVLNELSDFIKSIISLPLSILQKVQGCLNDISGTYNNTVKSLSTPTTDTVNTLSSSVMGTTKELNNTIGSGKSSITSTLTSNFSIQTP